MGVRLQPRVGGPLDAAVAPRVAANPHGGPGGGAGSVVGGAGGGVHGPQDREDYAPRPPAPRGPRLPRLRPQPRRISRSPLLLAHFPSFPLTPPQIPLRSLVIHGCRSPRAPLTLASRLCESKLVEVLRDRSVPRLKCVFPNHCDAHVFFVKFSVSDS